MESKELIQAIGEVDDKYVKEAVNYKRAGSRSLKVWRAVAIAACACLAGTLALTSAALFSKNFDSGDADFRGKAVSNDYDNEVTADFYEAEEYSEPMLFAAAEADYSVSEGAYETGSEENGAGIWEGVETGENTEAVPDTKKIIYYVWLDMQTREFDDAMTGIEAAAAQHGGYFESQNLSNSVQGYRSASYVIRVPADNLDTMLEQIGDICTVTYMYKSAEDVSSSYYDIEARLTTAETKLTRLQELLAEAEDMTDIIAIESAIADTELEIDNYKGSLKNYDSLVEYSTVSVSLSEVYEVVEEDAPMTFGEKLSQSFSQGLKGFGQFMANLLLWLANSWTALLLLAVIAVVIVVIIKGSIRRRRNRRKKQQK